MKTPYFIALLGLFLFLSCGSDDMSVTGTMPNPQTPVPQNPAPENPAPQNPIPVPGTVLKYLALGDSYTIGQNVCETCRFPVQLETALEQQMPGTNIELDIIATTGWTTTNLIAAVASENPQNDNDLVTLLIGVNNQYQHKPFSFYEQEFPQLVNRAIELAKGDKDNVIVVSIPDYAFTPYGQGSGNPEVISQELQQYNDFAAAYCASMDITFVYITDITQFGLQNPGLVASDGLHPSQTAYAAFVERILPKALLTLP